MVLMWRLAFRSFSLRESLERALDAFESLLELSRLKRRVTGRSRQARIAPPPVQTDLLCFINRANEEPDLNRQQLHIREIDLYVARDDKAFVEDAVEDVDQAVCAGWINELGQIRPSFSSSAKSAQWAEIDIQIRIREAECRLEFLHSLIELQESQPETFDLFFG